MSHLFNGGPPWTFPKIQGSKRSSLRHQILKPKTKDLRMMGLDHDGHSGTSIQNSFPTLFLGRKKFLQLNTYIIKRSKKAKVWVLQNSLCDLSFYPPNKNMWDAHVNSIGDERAKWEASARLWIPRKIAGNNDQYRLLLPLYWKLSFFNFCLRRSQTIANLSSLV